MKKKIDLFSPLTPEEQEWEDSIDPNAKPITDPTFLAEVKAGLARLQERRANNRGGSRPNSGRKPKEKITTSLNLTPAAKAKLKELAKEQPGGMSAVVNRLILTA
jgi:hypothetical protein